jgi:hypothetical protein
MIAELIPKLFNSDIVLLNVKNVNRLVGKPQRKTSTGAPAQLPIMAGSLGIEPSK